LFGSETTIACIDIPVFMNMGKGNEKIVVNQGTVALSERTGLSGFIYCCNWKFVS
jgi:hypothetical protein